MANEPDRDYSENIEKKFRALELRVEQDVVRRLRKAKEITSTADWQLNRYYVLGNSTRDIENIFKETVGDTYPEVFELYDKVLSQQYVRTAALYEQINEEAVPYDQNPEMRQLVDGLVRTSNDQLQNVTGSMGFMLDYGSGRMVFTPLAEIYDRYLDDAILDVASGAFDYGAVLRRVTRQLTNSGLRTIDYPTGHTNRCDVAARRAIMTGIAQLTGTITEQNAAKLGTKYYEVEWHAGARPTHMVWQGKVYHEDDLRRECGLGDPLGLCGINCYHRYYPFISGVSVRSYTDEWLAEMNEKELTPHAYRGKEYTRYEAEQRQRYLETCIRAQRERVSLLKTGDADHDDVIIQQCRYQAMLDEYRKFSKAMTLPTQAERFYNGRTVGRIAPSREVYTKYRAQQQANYHARMRGIGAFPGAPETVDGYKNLKYNDPKKYELLRGYEKAVKNGDIHVLTGFAQYLKTAKEIDDILVGAKTSTGITIESYTTHFVDRTIGQTSTPHKGMRTGVLISDSLDAIQNTVEVRPVRLMADGDIRQTFVGKSADVTISITDKRLIQTNPG